MEKGAEKLRRVIKHLEGRASNTDVLVNSEGPQFLRVGKRTKQSDNQTEFSFLVRVEKSGQQETWWPIEYRSASEVVSCETTVNTKVMVNMARQESLIELAETWAKTLEAQQIAKSVGNALL